jgi:hypothetical protein
MADCFRVFDSKTCPRETEERGVVDSGPLTVDSSGWTFGQGFVSARHRAEAEAARHATPWLTPLLLNLTAASRTRGRMARTKQTARRSTGGRAPHKRVGARPRPHIPHFPVPRVTPDDDAEEAVVVNNEIAGRYETAVREAQRQFESVEAPADITRKVTAVCAHSVSLSRAHTFVAVMAGPHCGGRETLSRRNSCRAWSTHSDAAGGVGTIR